MLFNPIEFIQSSQCFICQLEIYPLKLVSEEMTKRCKICKLSLFYNNFNYDILMNFNILSFYNNSYSLPIWQHLYKLYVMIKLNEGTRRIILVNNSISSSIFISLGIQSSSFFLTINGAIFKEGDTIHSSPSIFARRAVQRTLP